MMQRDEYLIRRTNGIGSSDIAAICGLNKWTAPIDVYMDKLRLIEPKPDNDNMWFGREMQHILIKRYEKETGREIIEPPESEMPFVGFSAPWYLFSPDGLYGNNGNGKYQGIIECKTTGMSHIDEWGESNTDQIPEEYLIQCQWIMGGCDAQWADVPVLFVGRQREFRIYRINRDQELIDSLIQKGKDFWENHVIPAIPPPVDASKGWDTYFKAKWPKEEEDYLEIPPDADLNLDIEAIKDWDNQIKSAEFHKTYYQNKIKSYIGDHAGIKSDLGKITWKKSRDTEVVDWKGAFEYSYNAYIDEFNDDYESKESIIKQFTTIKPGPRVFRVSWSEQKEKK